MIDLFNDLKELLTDLSEEINVMKTNIERVEVEAQKAERVGLDIQKKVTEFQFSTQPRIDKINEILEKINKRAD